MLRKSEENKLIFLLFLFSFIIRLIVLLNSDDVEPFAGAVPAISSPGWSIFNFIGQHTPSLESYLIKISLLFNKTSMAMRVPNFILGSLLVIPFYFLVKILYNQEIALFSSFALSIFYKHINMSVISCTEIPLYFFIFTALYFFFKFKQTSDKKTHFLILSALTINLATMSRYEAWLFIPLLLTLLIKENKKYLFTFSFISMIFPILWMYIHYKLVGNPIKFYFWQIEAVRNEWLAGGGLGPYLTFLQRLFGWPWMLLKIFSLPLFLLGLFGLILSILKDKLALPFIFLIILSTLTLKVVNHTLFLHFNYAVFLSLFFIVFIIYGVSVLPKIKKVLLYSLILFLAIVWFQKTIKERPIFPPLHVKILNYFKNHLQYNETIAVLGTGREMLVKNLQLSPLSPRVYYIFDRYRKYTKRGEREVDTEWLLKYAETDKPNYIVINNVNYTELLIPDIKEILKFFPKAKAECVFAEDDDIYIGYIYKITYGP